MSRGAVEVHRSGGALTTWAVELSRARSSGVVVGHAGAEVARWTQYAVGDVGVAGGVGQRTCRTWRRCC